MKNMLERTIGRWRPMRPRIAIIASLLLGITPLSLVNPPSSRAQTPGLNIQLYASLSISGAVGTVFSVEYVTDLAQTNSWRFLVFLQLPASPYLWTDKSAPATGQRFYR